MLFGNINSPLTHVNLLNDPFWINVLNMLKKINEDSLLGVTNLIGDKMYIDIHTYLTKNICECRFEGHRDMIDIQYMIRGSEIIEWANKTTLITEKEYDYDRDIEFFEVPENEVLTKIHMKSGCFAVFFPDDAHRPQINDGYSSSVLKAVIKIHRELMDCKCQYIK